jgi:hypothetical protein
MILSNIETLFKFNKIPKLAVAKPPHFAVCGEAARKKIVVKFKLVVV